MEAEDRTGAVLAALVRIALEPAVIPQVAVCAQTYATYESGAK